MKFFVNFLSAFRIDAAFAIIPTLMWHWFWVSLILFVLGALSDFFDGYLARKYDVCTKIGGVMDHIGDKLLVANTLIMLTVMMRAWFIIVPVIILIARVRSATTDTRSTALDSSLTCTSSNLSVSVGITLS